jgi:hypothetical protein
MIANDESQGMWDIHHPSRQSSLGIKERISVTCGCGSSIQNLIFISLVTNSMAIATDTRLFQMNLDPNLFPGVSSSIEVHYGFSQQHAM